MSAPGFLSPAPPKGPAVDVFYVDGGRSRISVNTRQGGHRQCFLALMVGAPGSQVLAPRGPTANVLQLSGSCSETSGNASQGAIMSRMFLSKVFLCPCAAKDMER
jgi:hypothetical protein